MNKTPLSPAEQLKRDISFTRSDFDQLAAKVKLTSVRDAYASLDSAIVTLPLRVQKIRDRKYAFNRILESQAESFKTQWNLKRGSVLSHLTQESNSLQNLYRPLEIRVATLGNPGTTSATHQAVKNEINSFKTRISASERAVTEMFESLKNEVNQVQTQLNQIEKSLELGETASFGFLPTESLVRAVKAVWTRDHDEDKEDPEGFLFLTDQRLLFEQREEVATRKVLFVTTERKKVQNLLFEVPVFSIGEVKATKQGMLKNEDWLDLEFESGAFARSARLHLDGQDCNIWQRLINQVKARELDFDRAIAIDQAAVEKVKSAPVVCPACGGTLSRPVLRGMDTITCDFCGHIIKL
mgnify:CR=1 FL=1